MNVRSNLIITIFLCVLACAINCFAAIVVDDGFQQTSTCTQTESVQDDFVFDEQAMSDACAALQVDDAADEQCYEKITSEEEFFVKIDKAIDKEFERIDGLKNDDQRMHQLNLIAQHAHNFEQMYGMYCIKYLADQSFKSIYCDMQSVDRALLGTWLIHTSRELQIDESKIGIFHEINHCLNIFNESFNGNDFLIFIKLRKDLADTYRDTISGFHSATVASQIDAINTSVLKHMDLLSKQEVSLKTLNNKFAEALKNKTVDQEKIASMQRLINSNAVNIANIVKKLKLFEIIIDKVTAIKKCMKAIEIDVIASRNFFMDPEVVCQQFQNFNDSDRYNLSKIINSLVKIFKEDLEEDNFKNMIDQLVATWNNIDNKFHQELEKVKSLCDTLSTLKFHNNDAVIKKLEKESLSLQCAYAHLYQRVLAKKNTLNKQKIVVFKDTLPSAIFVVNQVLHDSSINDLRQLKLIFEKCDKYTSDREQFITRLKDKSAWGEVWHKNYVSIHDQITNTMIKDSIFYFKAWDHLIAFITELDDVKKELKKMNPVDSEIFRKLYKNYVIDVQLLLKPLFRFYVTAIDNRINELCPEQQNKKLSLKPKNKKKKSPNNNNNFVVKLLQKEKENVVQGHPSFDCVQDKKLEIISSVVKKNPEQEKPIKNNVAISFHQIARQQNDIINKKNDLINNNPLQVVIKQSWGPCYNQAMTIVACGNQESIDKEIEQNLGINHEVLTKRSILARNLFVKGKKYRDGTRDERIDPWHFISSHLDSFMRYGKLVKKSDVRNEIIQVNQDDQRSCIRCVLDKDKYAIVLPVKIFTSFGCKLPDAMITDSDRPKGSISGAMVWIYDTALGKIHHRFFHKYSE